MNKKEKWSPNLEKVRFLAARYCTYSEIAAFFKVSESLVKKTAVNDPTFKEALEQGRAEGRVSLRGKQFELAMSGDKTMLIWLGKQYLNQTTEGTGQEVPKNTLLSKYMPQSRIGKMSTN
jgi:hypothetical protein